MHQVQKKVFQPSQLHKQNLRAVLHSLGVPADYLEATIRDLEPLLQSRHVCHMGARLLDQKRRFEFESKQARLSQRKKLLLQLERYTIQALDSVSECLVALLALVAAAASFIIFGLWTIRGDTLEGEDKKYDFSPFWTVTIAFFMAEMGDKTQLATIALAVEYNTIIPVWMGTTLGMIISNGFGMIVGSVMGKHIPERAIKWVSAIIFIAFGGYGLYENLRGHVWSPAIIVGSMAVLAAAMYGMASLGAGRRRQLPVCENREPLKSRK